MQRASVSDKSIPDFLSGEECLFCHRQNIGPGWQINRHQITIRELEQSGAEVLANTLGLKPWVIKESQYRLGDGKNTRLLRRAEAYGKLDLLINHERGIHTGIRWFFPSLVRVVTPRGWT